jgi:hypothetical protein
MKICWDNIEGIKLLKTGIFNKYKNGKRIGRFVYFDECEYCHEPYLSAKTKLSKYCSNNCSNKHNKSFGISNGRYSNGSYCDNGYPSVSINGKNVRVHKMIAENVLGRKLKGNECVHHIDLNKSNNLNSNLVICDVSYHRLIHHKMAVGWVNKTLKKMEV